MKVVVLHEDPQRKAYYARVAQAVAAKLKIPCEITGGALPPAETFDKKPYAPCDILLLQGSRNGLKLALQLRRETDHPAIVFLAPIDIALAELLRSRPSGIQLAETPEEVVLALKHSFQEQLRRRKHMIIRSKEAVYRVPFSEISYLESCQRLIIVHAKQRQLQFYGKLAEVLTTLPPEQFVRCHQSYVVNLEKTQAMDKAQHSFRLSGGERVEISKGYYQAAVAQFEAFLNRC